MSNVTRRARFAPCPPLAAVHRDCGMPHHRARRRVRATSTATTCRSPIRSTCAPQEAADRVAKETNGRVEIKIFPNNQLGGDTDMLARCAPAASTSSRPRRS